MKRSQRENGFTINKVFIASVILVIAISGITGAMCTSRNLQMEDLIHRQARASIQSSLAERVNSKSYSTFSTVNAQIIALSYFGSGPMNFYSDNGSQNTKTSGEALIVANT